MALEKAQLDNGLTVYNDRIPGAYTNNVTMFVPYGSINEQPGDEGVAHVFEHCVHLETDDFSNRSDLRNYARTNGMMTNANTFYTRTLYLANGLGLEPNIHHLSQVLQHTHFPEEAVEHELKAVRREARTNLDDVDRVHWLASSNAVYQNPYGRAVIGYHNKLDFDTDTLKKLHEKYYKLGRMSLVVTGMAKMDEIINLAERYFEEDETPYIDRDVLPPVELREHLTTGLVREDDTSVRISVMHPMNTGMRDKFIKNRLVYGVASAAIRDACFQALRYEKGISYDGSMSFGTHNHPDAWSIDGEVTTDRDSIPVALDTFNDIFSRDNTSYDDNTILGSLAMYKYAYSRQLTSVDNRMDAHTTKLASYQEPVDIRTNMRKLNKTTIKDVRDAIDDLAHYTSIAPRYTHLTGSRDAIGEVDRIIDRGEFS